MPKPPRKSKPKLRTVCVYCGSSQKAPAAHRAAARQLGGILAKSGIGLVYGGGRVGLMGAAADGALAAGGRVTGVIPNFLMETEVGHGGLSKLFVTRGMHPRKARMFRVSDGFVILPGGPGTLDELFEVLTWRQLGLHDKPVVIVDLGGYWKPLLRLIDHFIDSRYARPSFREFFIVVSHVRDALPALRGDWPPQLPSRPKRF